MSSNIGEKTRAVFLAALMVVSVFGGTMALAGSAAAQQDDPITLLDENGTEAGKYSDLDTALDNAEQDYTIELTAGDYTLTDDVTISGLTIEGPNAGVAGDSDARDGEANVTFQANIDAENVTVDGVLYEEGSNRMQIYGANTTLKNTVVEVPDGTAPVRLHADNITIANNEFDGLGGNWIINSRQDETNLLDGIEVTDNVFQNAGDGVVQANGWTNALITGNNFSDLDADAVRLAYNVTGTEVTNNIIRNTGQNPDNLLTTGIFLNSVEGEVEISGNEFENNPYHIVVFGNSDEPVIENNEFDKRVDVTDADFADNHIAGQIQAAVDDAAEDATVEVGPGTYNESVTIDTKNVTLTSTAGPEQTKITDPDNHKETVEVTASNVTVDGFTVTSGETVDSNYGSYGIRVIPRSGDINGVTVKNNILKNISDVYRATGVSVSAGVTGNQLQDITVENNTVYDIETTVTTRPKAGNSIAKGITLNGDVKSSEVINNNITDIGGEESAGAHGITLDGGGPTNFTVANNRINSLEINQSVSEEDPYFDDKSAIIVGGFADLGDNHSVYSNNLLDGQVYRYDAGEATDTLDATSNWWGATNGPSGDFDGNGSAVTGPVSIDPATVSLDDGSVNLTQDFLGVVKDSQNVTLSDTSDATFSFDSESVPGDVDGTLVIGINGTDYVFEDALNEGEVDTAVGGGAADSGKTGASIADTTPTGDTAITVVGNNSTAAVDDAGTVRLVHEVQNIGEGYTLTSLPQPAEVYTTDVSDFTSWSNAGSNYDDSALSTDGSLVTNSEAIHKGQYANGDSSDARIGYDFVTPSESDVQLGAGGSEELAEGFHLVGSNYNIEGSNTEPVNQDLSTVRNLPADAGDYEGNESFVAYDPVSFGEVGGSSTVDNHEGYWVYVDVGEDSETRTIKLARYDPAAS